MKKNKILSTFIILAIAYVLNTNMCSAATATAVSAPATLKAASVGYNCAKVSWGYVKGADGYQIYRATSPSGTYSSMKAITSTSYTNTGLITGKTYYYRVKTFKYSGTRKVYSKYSTAVSAKPMPSTPTNSKSVSTGYNSAKLTWNSVSGASGYQVYSATSSTGSYHLIKTTPYISYNNISLATEQTYYYKIRAYRTVGTTKVYGGLSITTSAKPILAIPSKFKGTPVSNTSTTVSWGVVSGASGYQLSRATSSTGTFIDIKTTISTSYNNTELTSGTTYYYKVRAYRMVGTKKVYSKFTTVVTVVTKEFDSSIASKNITSDFKDVGSGVIAILSNNNSYSISLSATIVFYDETGLMLGKTSEYNNFFETGKKCALYFSGPYDNDYNRISYSSYKIIYAAESTEYQISNLSDIKITSNFGSDNVMVEVTNSGIKSSEYTEIGIVFFKDGEAIALEYQYAECGIPGSIDYLEFSFPYDQNYETIQIDNYEVYVNSSYNYEW